MRESQFRSKGFFRFYPNVRRFQTLKPGTRLPEQPMKDGPYYKQAELMLKTIPHVAAEPCFALKGGTAINLFVRHAKVVCGHRSDVFTSR